MDIEKALILLGLAMFALVVLWTLYRLARDGLRLLCKAARKYLPEKPMRKRAL